jgi:transposase-like protein
MDAPKTLLEAIQFFSDAENCRQFMIAIRWEDGIVRCPVCDSDAVIYLANAKLYYCRAKHAKQKFSLKVGTIFEDSPIGLDKWLPAYWLLANCKNGISSYELARAIGVTQKSAWFMLHRIRYSMQKVSDLRFGQQGRPVEIDEVFIGGKPKNMHVKKRRAVQANGQLTDKPVVMGMLDRETREVRAKLIPNVKRETLQAEILDQVVLGSKIFTDGYKGYGGVKDAFVHDTVSHINEYVRGEVHTNGIENFWSLLKRTLTGTYVAVEPFHLDQYVAEQVFRFNNRKNKDDYDRFALAVSQGNGKRLTLAELTGKTQQQRPF